MFTRFEKRHNDFMTEAEIKNRLARVYAAFGDKTNLKPEDFEPEVQSSEDGFTLTQDFRGGRSQEDLDGDAASIINEIMGIRDRAKKWLRNSGGDDSKVDTFIKSDQAVSLVHDLANTDKHGELDGPPFSGHKPNLVKVDRFATLKYDRSTGTYAKSGQIIGAPFDFQTGEISGSGTSSDMEVVLGSDIHDENGNKIGELQKVLPDAIYKWEQFLISEGLSLK